MKRILLVVASLDLAGPERQVALLAAGLPRDEFEVHLCALRFCQNASDDPLMALAGSTTVIGQRRAYDIQVFSQLRKHILRLKPDLAHFWPGAANTYGRAAAVAAGVRQIVSSQWSFEPTSNWSLRWRDWLVGRRTQSLVANSRSVWDALTKAGIPERKLRLIPGAIERQTLDRASPPAVLAELRLASDARLIGAVGPLELRARVDDLIWAADLLKVVRDDVHLLIVGTGSRQESLDRFRRNCRIEDRVHFLGHCPNLAQLMPHLELLWLGGSTDGLPHGVMQAMACGLPIVAADCWGARELVIQGETGLIVAPGDRAGLARNANKLLEQPALAQRLGTAGRARIESHFPVDAMVLAHAKLYREIMG